MKEKLKEKSVQFKPYNQSARFWVFDDKGVRVNHAFFPTRRQGEDSVKFAPNTCMGCHYTFDSRKFNVVTPSFEALNLSLFETDTGPVWRDHGHCADRDDVIVVHDVFVDMR